MTVFATAQSLVAGLFRRILRANPLAPARRVRRRYPKTICGACGREFAHTSRGIWNHKCAPVPAADREGES